jgi:phage-related protein
MANLGFKFGSYSFSGTGALIYDYEIKGGSRINQQVIPLRDGAQINEALISPVQVTLKGTLNGSSPANLRDKKDLMFKYLLIGTQNLYIWDDRYINAQVQSLNYDYKAAMSYMPFQVTFIAGTPFWVAVSTTTNQQTISANPTSYSITTSGSAYARPIVTFIANQGGTIANFSFENSSTDESFSYIGSVALNGTLEIDCENFVVEKNNSDDIANFNGDFLRLINGANAMTYSGGNCTLLVTWYNRYY